MVSASPSGEDPVSTLDLRGLKCPMPVLRTRKLLRRVSPGARVEVLCTDPLAAIDIPHLISQSGHVLEEQTEAKGVLRFVVRKAVPKV